MNNNKSPGPDGLPKEYYSIMWKEIKYDLFAVMQGITLENKLDPDFTTGQIKLLYKKGEPSMLKNWRPISLLNVDLKILTSVISTRLSKILPKTYRTTSDMCCQK
jgi:hypothetical protein